MSQADASAPADSTNAPRGPVALVYSPHAGSAQGAHPQALLEGVGVTVGLSLPVAGLNGAETLGRRWREAGCVAVVAAGGDGTVGAVARHAAEADLPLGVLPLGTANDIARAFRIPMAPAAAARVIARGSLRWLDAGEVVPLPVTETASGDYFLHAMTLGLNVEFARRATNVAQRQIWGKLTYIISAIESLEHLRPIPVTLRFRGMPGEPEGTSVVVETATTLLMAVNLPIIGGRLGLRLAGIQHDDRMLDLIAVEAPEPSGAGAAVAAALDALAGMARLLGGAPGGANPVDGGATLWYPEGVALPGARWFRARAVGIETAEPVDLTLDGELRGRTPVLARVAPRGVWVIAPEEPQGVKVASGLDARRRDRTRSR
jgi:diacylglycerol kinase family enzyme